MIPDNPPDKKIVFFLLILFFMITIPAFSRDVTIIVNDADLKIPLEGAMVRVRGGREYICGADGSAFVLVPDNRQVVIQAFYPGYEAGILTLPLTGDEFTISLHIALIMQGRDLIIEAARPGSSESRTGRSVAVGEREIAQTAEIGIIEDVMSTIKLLPGVSYSGFLDAEPSIRGGQPGDMSASLNGFYINNPFFWGGTFSIFDPRMVQSAQLSHGVFSSRYGHTISGLLEITSKNPSSTETQAELSISTSAANFNLSIPFSGKGGILLMGRITYYDPVLFLAGGLSDFIPELSLVKAFGPVPYIRALTANGSYRFNDNLELSATAFFGMDGVGIAFNNSSIVDNLLNSNTIIEFLFTNYHAFFTSTVSWNPNADMLLKFLIGSGYEEQVNFGNINYDINRPFSENGIKNNPLYAPFLGANYSFQDGGYIDQSESNLNLQGRIDFDWGINDYLLLSAGIQAMYNHFNITGIQNASAEINFKSLPKDFQDIILLQIKSNFPSFTDDLAQGIRIIRPVNYSPDSSNNLLSTSLYILGEYNPVSKLNIELGLRIDHFILTGKNNFSINSDIVFNPRFNLEFNLLNGTGFFKKIDLCLGTGLFSSINDSVFSAEERYNIDKIKPNRSWTSIVGFNFELPKSIKLSIEGYYKYVYDRMYVLLANEQDGYDIQPKFDGEGIVWGIDVMLQKMQSRFWDGWISYSFSWAKYREPYGILGARGIGGGIRGPDWYFPSFHRFHTINFIFNYKPVQNMNIYMRLGVASGVPLLRRSEEGPKSYPVYRLNDGKFIEKYVWENYLDENYRTTPSVTMDLKFSIFGGNSSGKTRWELYLAVENVLGLLYTAQGNTTFNQYTGEIDEGSFSASFDMPIPIPSFGFKMSY